MVQNDPKNKQQKSTDFGDAQGTQEREDKITGSVGVKNRQGENIERGPSLGEVDEREADE